MTFHDLAERLFLKPSPKYAYSDIIRGVRVCGKTSLQKAVGRNTFRGFYRKSGYDRGASSVFDPYFEEKKEAILDGLKGIPSRGQLDNFSEEIRQEIKDRLTNVEEKQLLSYNKTRKPVDLYIEHIVSMAEEISDADRLRLVPFLFLPLDSWIFSSPQLFTESDLRLFGLSRRSTYKDVATRHAYEQLHLLTLDKARSFSPSFHPIYFDLLWSERFNRKQAGNLFESNP